VNTLIILGALAYALCVPGFAWLSSWLYVYFQPLDRPVDLAENLRYLMAGAAIGAIVATVLVGVMIKHNTFAW
jgi:hypothetical protein